MYHVSVTFVVQAAFQVFFFLSVPNTSCSLPWDWFQMALWECAEDGSEVKLPAQSGALQWASCVQI